MLRAVMHKNVYNRIDLKKQRQHQGIVKTKEERVRESMYSRESLRISSELLYTPVMY